jgi:hypothetical protein
VIQITRACVRQFRAALKKAGAGKNQRPLVEIVAGQGEVRLRAVMPDVTIELKQPGPSQEESIRVPFEALADFESKSTANVTFARTPDGVEASWEDGRIPHRKAYAVAEPTAGLTVPEVDWATKLVVTGLIQALGHANQCVAGASVRYATDKIQLQGERGQINATDGRQALIQTGFTFPWKEDLLIPGLALFGCRELVPDLPASICKGKNRIAIQVGDWTFYIVIETQGRFPDIASVVPNVTASATRLRLSSQDAEFLARSLAKLPGSHDEHAPMTVDLNDQVALRVKEEGQGRPTEIVLAGSHVVGSPVRIHSDRRFLQRAVSLGFDELTIISADKPVVCKDNTRTYIWVPLDKSGIIPPSDKAIRITTEETTPQPIKERMIPPMPTSNSNGRNHANGERQPTVHAATNGNGQANGATEHLENSAAPTGTSLGALIAEAHAVRDSLHDGYARASRLCVSLKRHRKQSKLVATTLASLRQLQQIEG